MKNKKDFIIVYDIRSCPIKWSIKEVLNTFNDTGIVFYDKFNGGNKPELINLTKNNEQTN